MATEGKTGETQPPPVWVCDRCGYKTADRFTITVSRGGSSHCCDSCGGELVCSECYDHPEFCECVPAESGRTEGSDE